MKLHEYQSKAIFANYGIPIPKGSVVSNAEEARQIAAQLGTKVVVKAQVLVGGRGKAGGVKVAATPDEAEQIADQILSMEIKGLPVRKVLVDEALNIAREIYLGIVVDRAARRATVIASAAGGMDIEEVARTAPEKIIRKAIDPALGLQGYQAREIAFGIGMDKALVREFTQIADGLYRAFQRTDASLAEINPLVVTAEGKLIAADGKIVVDDNALYRHADLEQLRDADEESESEQRARKAGLSFVKLDGDIGCMVNGAGLAMATMDVIKFYDGEPANFLDIGGGAKADKVKAALEIILSDPNVKAVLFNIFGGITRGDEVAQGIVDGLKAVNAHVPMIARIVGTNAEEGRRILASANMITAETLEEGAQKAVAAAKSNGR
ncbi:MAG: ADP-forming succinate--CoA ligase subunit beta [Chloroflexi bacterium]|nr:ADP-forming succinate--CoA ligase subunit beta [Chloroflexota bacterium]